MKWLTRATKMGSTWTKITLLATEVKLRLVIQLAKWTARTTPTPTRASFSLVDITANRRGLPPDAKNGRIMSVDRAIRHVAIAIGGAVLNLMRIDAVETATMLTSRARFGGKDGLSVKLIPDNLGSARIKPAASGAAKS
jgi:hypothetical protein